MHILTIVFIHKYEGNRFSARSVHMHVVQKKGKIVNSQFDHIIWTAVIYCAFTWTAEIVRAYARSVHRIIFEV